MKQKTYQIHKRGTLLDNNPNNPDVFCDGNVHYWPNFIEPNQAELFYQQCAQQLAWSQEYIAMFGKKIAIPRLQAWYGDNDAHYTYSGLPLIPLPWVEPLLIIKASCEEQLEYRFNSVLANFYRNHQDSMGWHSDNEKQLGKQPVIASISLGQTRKFSLKHKISGEILHLNLQSGSLLVMRGDLQSHWQHSLPKSAKPLNGRINLTFRHVFN